MSMHMGDRKPYGRTGEDKDLPDGKTCNHCAHCLRFRAIVGDIPADESCEWSSSRYCKAERSNA